MSEITWPRRYAWSVRRELWEHPSLWITPVAAGLVVIVAFLVSRLPAVAAARSTQLLASEPYDAAIGVVMLTAYIAAAFYCLDSMYGERRDRSILFWKSLPVSDTMTVLAKLAVALVVVPLIIAAATMATLVVLLPLSDAHPPLLRTSVLLLYHLFAVHTLWWAPLFGWLLLISAWARRAPIVWAIVPIFVFSGVERIAFGTSYFAALLSSHFLSATPDAIVVHGKLPTDPMTRMTPAALLSSPGLWLGLGMTALLVVLAIRLRRERGPI